MMSPLYYWMLPLAPLVIATRLPMALGQAIAPPSAKIIRFPTERVRGRAA
jgi:hypothetical protein